jgi:hypothetical protein
MGMTFIPGTLRSHTVASAPIVGRERVHGLLIFEDTEREHAIDQSALRLMTVIGTAMGMALERGGHLRDLEGSTIGADPSKAGSQGTAG